MDTTRSTNWLNQRLIRKEHSWAISSEKFVYNHKREFWVILIAVLVLGLITAFLFAQMPIAGENFPIPGYP
jgi:hypothetical protein